jgi:hypothetical protein
MQKIRSLLVSLVAVAMGVLSAAPAFAVDPATAGEALATFSGSTTAYGPVLFGLAVVSTGIMLGIAWIKKARGAGR